MFFVSRKGKEERELRLLVVSVKKDLVFIVYDKIMFLFTFLWWEKTSLSHAKCHHILSVTFPTIEKMLF